LHEDQKPNKTFSALHHHSPPSILLNYSLSSFVQVSSYHKLVPLLVALTNHFKSNTSSSNLEWSYEPAELPGDSTPFYWNNL